MATDVIASTRERVTEALKEIRAAQTCRIESLSQEQGKITPNIHGDAAFMLMNRVDAILEQVLPLLAKIDVALQDRPDAKHPGVNDHLNRHAGIVTDALCQMMHRIEELVEEKRPPVAMATGLIGILTGGLQYLNLELLPACVVADQLAAESAKVGSKPDTDTCDMCGVTFDRNDLIEVLPPDDVESDESSYYCRACTAKRNAQH